MEERIIKANFTKNTRVVQMQHLNAMKQSENEVANMVAPDTDQHFDAFATCTLNLDKSTETRIKQWAEVMAPRDGVYYLRRDFSPTFLMVRNGELGPSGKWYKTLNPLPEDLDIVIDKTLRYISCCDVVYEVPKETFNVKAAERDSV